MIEHISSVHCGRLITSRDAKFILFREGLRLSSEESNHCFCSFEAVVSEVVSWEILRIGDIKLKSLSTETRRPALGLFPSPSCITGLGAIGAEVRELQPPLGLLSGLAQKGQPALT